MQRLFLHNSVVAVGEHIVCSGLSHRGQKGTIKEFPGHDMAQCVCGEYIKITISGGQLGQQIDLRKRNLNKPEVSQAFVQ